MGRVAVLAFVLSVLCLNVDSSTSSEESESCSADTCEGNSYAKFSSTKEGWKMPNGLFESNLEEVVDSEVSVTFGEIPDWLQGTLYRVGAGMYEMGDRKVNNVVDGLSKVHKWSLSGEGKPRFSAFFLRSSMYNRTVHAKELVPMRHLGQMHPSPTTFETIKMMFYDELPDNNNIAAWELGKNGITITAESPIYIDLDFRNLNFQRKHTSKSSDTGMFEKEVLSASHFWRHPSSGDSINYKLVIPMDMGIFSGNKKPAYHLYRYKEDTNGQIISTFVGKVPIEKATDMRLIHSLGCTEKYIILPRFSLYVEMNDFVEIGKNMKFDKNLPTYFDVISLEDGSRKTFTFGAYESQHIFNSYERENDKGELEIVVDYPTLESVDNLPDKNIFELLNIESLKDPNFSYLDNWEAYTKFTLRRFILNMATGEGNVYDYPKMWSPLNLQVEFPYINVARRGLPYCFVYLQTWNHEAHNAMGLLKVDMCRATSIGWEEVNKFPVEPVFAARPGTTDEDDGVILSPVYDSVEDSTSLYIWDAKTLQVIAIISTPVVMPFSVHGIWVDGVF